jgi:hypothetical protein
VARGLQPHRAELLGLEPLQRLGRAAGALGAEDLLFGRGRVVCGLAVEVDLLVAHGGDAPAPDLHGFVFDDNMKPPMG